MEIKAKYNEMQIKDDKVFITFETDRTEIKNILLVRNLTDKILSLVVQIFRNKRSLDANSYMWVLCQKIAEVINTSKDEVYLQMLQRYGVFTHGIFKPKAAERVKQEWRAVVDLGEVTVNGQTGIQLQMYYGSSSFDTKEMSTLLNGIVEECKILDIETKPEDEIKSLCEEWGK